MQNPSLANKTVEVWQFCTTGKAFALSQSIFFQSTSKQLVRNDHGQGDRFCRVNQGQLNN